MIYTQPRRRDLNGNSKPISQTCAECGRTTLLQEDIPPIQSGPGPIAPVPESLRDLPKCDRCGKSLAQSDSSES